jgi:hypothetical protein
VFEVELCWGVIQPFITPWINLAYLYAEVHIGNNISSYKEGKKR